MKQTIKPRTQLVLDIGLFSLLMILLLAIFIQQVVVGKGSRAYHVLGQVHGVVGVLLTVLLALHLYWHLPWITAQWKAFRRGSAPSAKRRE